MVAEVCYMDFSRQFKLMKHLPDIRIFLIFAAKND